MDLSRKHKSRLYFANALVWLAMGIGLVILGVWSKGSMKDSNLLVLLIPMAIIFAAFQYLLNYLFKKNVKRIEGTEKNLPFFRMMDSGSAAVLVLYIILTIIFSPYNETWAYFMTITMIGCGLAAFDPGIRYLIKSIKK